MPTNACVLLHDPLLSGDPNLIEICCGELPLTPGAQGAAVVRLREALARLGFVAPPTLGSFDRPLEAALRAFQEWSGRPVTGVLDAATLQELDRALLAHATPARELEVLLNGKYTTPEYAVAVSSWPEARPIWPLLRLGYVRIGFVRFCLNYIRLGTHPRSSRTGAASYVYARLSDRAELDDVTRQHLQVTTRLDCRRVPACLRLPLLLASSPERTLVALHLGGPPQWIDSYLFIEPWDDEIIVPRSEQWYDIVERDWIVLSDLAACDADGRLRMGADALLLPRGNSGPRAAG